MTFVRYGPTGLELCNCKGTSGRSRITQTTGYQLQRWGVPDYYLANFSGKLHGNERNKTEGPFMTPFDPPMDTVVSTLLELMTLLSVNDRNLDDLATDLRVQYHSEQHVSSQRLIHIVNLLLINQ